MGPQNIKQLLNQATNKLVNKKIPSAHLDAEVLLSHTLSQPKEFLYTHPEYCPNQGQINKFKKLINQRAKFEPIAYLMNRQEFYGIEFMVNRHTLIPRPETEILVDEVKNYLENQKPCSLVICDIGTGSGAIIVTLAKLLPNQKLKFLGVDISRRALKIAEANAKKHQVRIKFIHSNLLAKLKKYKIDLIVANLPYLDQNYKNTLNSSVNKPLKFEPTKALFAGQHGLAVYKRLFDQITRLKYQPSLIICEISSVHSIQARTMAKKYFPQRKISLKKDLAKLPRVLIIKA